MKSKKLDIIRNYWRPSVAFIYLFLNLIDYAVRPILNYILEANLDISSIAASIKNLDPVVQVKAMELLTSTHLMAPILPEFFHVAFGAILGAAAFTRGQEKIAYIKKEREIFESRTN